ncbi:MAG: tetratricopeptide repeat protein [Hyphomonadaceae bacterium]
MIAAAGLFAFTTTASAQTTLPPPAFGGADARQDRIEDLERQLREQTAQNEQLQYELNQAQREITRLRAMVGELAGVNQDLSSGPPADPNAPPASGAAPAGPDTSGLNGAQQRATGTLGTMPANTPIPQPDPGTAYGQARALLIDGRYAEAEVAFGQFLEQFPQAPQSADARFWFAFTLLARNNYQDAAANFVNYLQANPNGQRAPEAQVRLGMALVGMGQIRQGCGAFNQLTRRYPNAPRNIRDLAVREARAANCSA